MTEYSQTDNTEHTLNTVEPLTSRVSRHVRNSEREQPTLNINAKAMFVPMITQLRVMLHNKESAQRHGADQGTATGEIQLVLSRTPPCTNPSTPRIASRTERIANRTRENTRALNHEKSNPAVPWHDRNNDRDSTPASRPVSLQILNHDLAHELVRAPHSAQIFLLHSHKKLHRMLTDSHSIRSQLIHNDIGGAGHHSADAHDVFQDHITAAFEHLLAESVTSYRNLRKRNVETLLNRY